MKTLIAIPCMDMMHTDFVRSLIGLRVEGEVEFCFSQNSLVYDSRNLLAQKAVDRGFDRVLWLDSDMVFRPDLLERLGADLADGRELVSALYTTRKQPIRPAAYQRLGTEKRGGVETPVAVPVREIPEGLREVEGVGFGCVLTSARLLKDVAKPYGRPFSPIDGFGEDFSFCLKARSLGFGLWLDGGVRVGHVGLRVYDATDLEVSEDVK